MKQSTIAIFLFAVLATIGTNNAAPTATSAPNAQCSPIIPPDSCATQLTQQEASGIANSKVLPMIGDIYNIADSVKANLSATCNASTAQGPYARDTLPKCYSTINGSIEPRDHASCISYSVFRLKCQVLFVANIVLNETVRDLVDEESNFAAEFQNIIKKLVVLKHLSALLSGYREINSCQVVEGECTEVEYDDRLTNIKASVCDLALLTDHIRIAVRGFFGL